MILLLPFFLVAWVAGEVFRAVDEAADAAFLRARDKAREKVQRWASQRKRRRVTVPPRVRKAWAYLSTHTAAAGRFTGRLLPQAVVEGARRGAAEGRQRHREYREIRPVKAAAKKAHRSSPQYREYSQLRHQQHLARKTRRAGAPAQAADPANGYAVPDEQQRPGKPACEGTCTNSDMDPSVAEDLGLCGTCVGRRELVSDFGGQHRHTPCRDCAGSGKSQGTYSNTNGHTPSNGGTDMTDKFTQEAVDQLRNSKWASDLRARLDPAARESNRRNDAHLYQDVSADQLSEEARNTVRAANRDGNDSSSATAASYSSAGAQGISEVTSVDSLRRVYASTETTIAEWQDQLSAASRTAESLTATYDQATGHLTSERFDPQTLAEAAEVHDQVDAAKAKVTEALAALDSAHASAAKARSGLERHRHREEAMADGPAPAVHSVSYAPS